MQITQLCSASSICFFCILSSTCRLYSDLTNCTYIVAQGMNCYWPNRMVDEFFIQVHRYYFHNCSLSGRLLKDPPNRILGPFIVVPILVTLLMTALVVWRSKRSEGIVQGNRPSTGDTSAAFCSRLHHFNRPKDLLF